MNKVIAFFLWLLIISSATFAQTERGGIRGTVVDPSGGTVPNAKITATNVGTGIVTSTQSTTYGTYNFPELPMGVYRVEVTQPGFKGLVRENVEVAAASIVGLDLALEVGNATEVLTVSASGPMLRTESSDTTTEVSARAYVDLPLSASGGGRFSANFLQLVPGWTGTGTTATPDGNRMLDSMNGGQLSTKDIQIEGASTVTLEITGDGRNTIWPPDVVQELSVATSGYNAEYGNTGGGVERYVLKSGTNEIHGSAYEFLRNTVLDARGFFNVSRPIHKENEFGFTFGGPIVIPKLYNGRNKSFLFFGFNEYRYRTGGTTSVISLPNNAFRAGDFSGLAQPIYDPNTTSQLGNGTFTRDPFPGNRIPATRISTAAQNILSYVPQSATQANYNNYPARAYPSYTNRPVPTIKLDHYFNTKHHLSLSNVYAESLALGAGLFSNPIQTNGYGPYQDLLFNFGRATWDWTIAPTVLNQLRFGFNRQIQLVGSLENGFASPRYLGVTNWSTKLGIPGLGLGSADFPVITWGSFQTLNTNKAFSDATATTYVLSDALTWTKGRHNFKFGAEIRQQHHSFLFVDPIRLGFSRNETALPSALSTTGLEYASFLLGSVDNASAWLASGYIPHNIWSQYGAFAQDDFKLSRNVTVNYGLRWDLFKPLREKHDWYSVMDPTAPNPAAGNLPGAFVFAGQNGQGDRLTYAKNDASNFGPRVGVAWKVNDKVAVRSGYGISSFLTGAYGGGNTTWVLLGYWFTSTAQSLDSGVTPAFNLDQGFPSSKLIVPPRLDAGLGVGSGQIQYWDQSAGRAAYSQNWNFSTQTELAANLSLDLSYVGSKGTHLPVSDTDPNELNPSYYSLGSLLNSSITSPAVVAAGYKVPYAGFTGSLAQALRPFPQYVTSMLMRPSNASATLGNSTYHSLQAKLSKRFSSGLYALATYAWQKMLTDAPANTVFQGGVSGRDNYNRALDKIIAPFNRYHRFVTAFTYELPFGPGKRFMNHGGFAGKLIGGWQMNGILTYMSGVPIAVSAPQSLPLNGGPQTPNSVIGVSPMGSWSGKFDPATNRYLNASAFALPAAFTFGTSANYLPNVTSPNFYNEDVGLVKNTRITERFSLQTRFEAFNSLNRHVFASPSGNLGTPQTFGLITGVADAPRNAQVAMKLTF